MDEALHIIVTCDMEMVEENDFLLDGNEICEQGSKTYHWTRSQNYLV